jgi:hypothetical protein
VRDYAEVGERDRPLVVPYGMRERENGRTLLFQVWDFFDDCYDLSFYFVFDDGKNVTTRVFRSRYSLITVDRLMALAREAGFSSVERLDDVFFQPLIVARRGEGG